MDGRVFFFFFFKYTITLGATFLSPPLSSPIQDLPRTFPHNPAMAAATPALRRILLGFAAHGKGGMMRERQ